MSAPLKIPTYSICNLMGANNCIAEILVRRLSDHLNKLNHFHTPHRHSFFQLLIFTSGSGSHTVDFDVFEIKPGQVYFLAPGQVHSWQLDAGTDGFIINFNETFFTAVCYNPHFLNEFPFFNAISGKSMMQLQPGQQAPIIALTEKLLEEFSGDEDFKNDLLRAYLLQLLIQFARNCRPEGLSPANRQHYLLLRNFEKLVEQHYSQKKLPKEYAEMLFVTPSHLNAMCNATTGRSAGEMIRDRVLLEAKRLLVNSQLHIAEIAYQLNFEDNAYFSRFFKKYTSVTPEAFRKTHKV
ncbi:MAG: helix-turn-helix domain-containing protein [Bacteroidota bacterium]